MLFYCLLTFFKIIFFFQEHYQSVKQFGSRSGPTLWYYVGPDLGAKCLKMISAEEKRRQLQGKSVQWGN